MPLLFDMPLEKLRTYTGRNPCPNDFDVVWDRSLARLKEVAPQVELIPARFSVPYATCYDLFFTGVGDARIHAKLLHPTRAPASHPAVLAFHGYSGSAGDWTHYLPYVALGFTVAAMDCRGQGGLSEDTGGVSGWTLRGHIVRGLEDEPEKMLFHQIYLDTVQLARVVSEMPEVDPERIGVMGGSQGGGLSLACAALEPRIKRVALRFPFLCDFKRVWDLDLDENAYAELREYFRRFDPLHEREEEIFTKLGYVDVQFLAPRIRGEVLMAVGLMDKICPPSTQFAAYNKIKAKKSLVIYPDYGHEDLPRMADRTFEFLSRL